MKRRFVIGSCVLLGSLLSACSTRLTPAPIDDRSAQRIAPKVPHGRTIVEHSDEVPVPAGSYMVKRGDTLYSIALEHGQNYRDLVVWNNLASADVIQVGQVLRVAPPEGEASPTKAVKPENITSRPLESDTSANKATPVKPVDQKELKDQKNEPQGLKRPYSDELWQKMQSSTGAAKALPANDKPIEKTTEKPVEKPVEKSVEKTQDHSGIEQKTENVDGIAFSWPASGKVGQPFSETKNKGLNILGKVGDPIFSAADGKVVYAGSGLRGYGNLLIIRHSKNVMTAYAHNDKLLVKENQTVKRGQKIAELGQSDSSIPQLHFEVRQSGKPVDPIKYLPQR